LAALAFLNSFLHFFQLKPACLRIVRKLLRLMDRSSLVATHCLSFFSVQPWPLRLWSTGWLVVTVSTMSSFCVWSKRGCGPHYVGKPRSPVPSYGNDGPSPLLSGRCAPSARPIRSHGFGPCQSYTTLDTVPDCVDGRPRYSAV
jgi:hypothetical protein